MDEARLAAIQAAAEGATAGKWHLGRSSVDGSTSVHSSKGVVAGDVWAEDGVFIALARTAVPELLAHVGVLRAENQRLRDEVEARRAAQPGLLYAPKDVQLPESVSAAVFRGLGETPIAQPETHSPHPEH